MITPEDLALAESLLRAGKLDRARLEKLFSELLARPEARLAQLLTNAESDNAPTLPPDTPAPAVLRPAGNAQNVVPGAEPGTAPYEGGDAVTMKRGPKVLRRLGKYDLHEEVGRGGMGIIYKATDNALKRTVALKTLLAPEGAGHEIVERFLREARAAAALSHPNIVPIHDVGEADGIHFFTMEYVDGQPLESLLLERGALPARIALEIARDCARALDHAHRAGIVHRDVKPGNILLRQADPKDTHVVRMEGAGEPTYRVLLADFGLAREVDAPAGLTHSGNLIGTPAYMSPEQASGHVTKVDARSDVYSLGCVMYRMLTGILPYPGNTFAEILPLVIASEPVPVCRRKPELHRDIQTIVAKAMAREPGRRYPSAGELAEDVDRYLKGEAIHAAPESIVYRMRRSIRRNTAAWTAVAFCLLMLAASGGWLFWKDRSRAIDTRQRAEQHVMEGRRLMEAAAWEDALREFGLALDLAPGLMSAETGRREARYRRFRSQAQRLVDTRNWEGALSLLASGDEWSDRPEIQALGRLARGVATLEVVSAEPAEADLVPAEPGIYWDEETFPPVADARTAGLAKPLGTTPVARADIEPGEYFLVWSRGNAVLRVMPLIVGRSEDVKAEYRVFRVGPGSAHRTVPEALKEALPGAVLELEAGTHEAGWNLTVPGVMLRPVKGAQVALRPPEGVACLHAGSSWGIALVDLELLGGREAAFLGTRTPRTTVVRCHVHDFDKGGISITAQDGFVRDCRLERALEQAIHVSGSRHLVLMNRVDDCGWSGITLEGEHCLAVRNHVTGGARIGIFGTKKPGLRILENVCSGCPDWGILVNFSDGALVADNLCTGNGLLASRDGAANIAAGDGRVEVRHNTTWGGGNGIVFMQSPSPLVDNISAGHAGWGIYFHTHACQQFDYNLIWKCSKFARFIEQEHEDLASLQASHANLNLGQMRRGLESDPRFVDPAKGDFRLASGSPARGAASDGGDLGARLDQIRDDPVDSVAWIRRHNGQTWLRQGRDAISAGDKEGALVLLKRASLLLPGHPEIPELLRRASE